MSTSHSTKILARLGLHANEARIYLASLSLGVASVIDIARETGIKRTTVYHAIDSLTKRGLMSVEIDGLKKRYAPESPERLYAMLDAQRDELAHAYPDLETLFTAKKERGTIKKFEGLGGIKAMYTRLLSLLRRGDNYYAVSDAQAWKKYDPDWFHDYVEKRGKLGLDSKLLLKDNETGRWYKEYEKNFNLEVKLFPPGDGLQANVSIAGGYVVFQRLNEPLSGTLISDSGVADIQRQMFLMLWEKY